MLDSCRLIFERSHFERSEIEFFRSRFSELLELNSCAKLKNSQCLEVFEKYFLFFGSTCDFKGGKMISTIDLPQI